MRTFWSSFGELDNLLNKSPEEKREILRDWYDPDMIDKLEDDQLDEVISDDPTIYDDAARDFEDEIAPMISSQVRNGLIFDEKFNLIDPVELLDFDGYSAELDEDEVGDLSFNVEGRKAFPLYGFSEDDNEFIEQLRGLGVLDTLHNLYPDMDDEDFDDPYYWEDLIPFDWEMLGQNLTHVKDLGNLGESCDEQLDEAKAKNPTKLADELEEIKDLSDEYGREYFTQMPFTSFDNDPISIEMQYPEFFRIVKAFFKEMDILTPEELNDADELDYQWDQGIDQHDWDVLMKVCDKLAQGKGTQIEKEYKTGYNSPLDDDEILAARKDESLTESEEPRKFEVDNNFIYVGIGDDQHDIGEIWDDGTVELFDPERWSAEDRKKMLKDLKALGYYYCSFLDESLNEDDGIPKKIAKDTIIHNAEELDKFKKDKEQFFNFMIKDNVNFPKALRIVDDEYGGRDFFVEIPIDKAVVTDQLSLFNEEYEDYGTGIEFKFDDPEITLDLYLQWEGIIGFSDDIFEFGNIGYDDLEAYLNEEGIYGYTSQIYNIINGKPAFCRDMEEEDFISLCRSNFVDPKEAHDSSGATSIKNVRKYSVVDLIDGTRYDKYKTKEEAEGKAYRFAVDFRTKVAVIDDNNKFICGYDTNGNRINRLSEEYFDDPELDESLNEDTATWPWGDPNLELPRKKEKIIDDSSLDNMID